MSRAARPPPAAFRSPPRLCPFCGYTLNAGAPGPDTEPDAQPEAGDWSMCARCVEPLVLDANLAPERPPLGAYAALALADPETHAMMERQRELFRRFKDRGGFGGGFGGGPAEGSA